MIHYSETMSREKGWKNRQYVFGEGNYKMKNIASNVQRNTHSTFLKYLYVKDSVLGGVPSILCSRVGIRGGRMCKIQRQELNLRKSFDAKLLKITRSALYELH